MWKEAELCLTACFMQVPELLLDVYMMYAGWPGSVITSGSRLWSVDRNL